MLDSYLPILIFIILGLIFALAPLVLSKVFAPHAPNPKKNSAYECGFAPFDNARIKFDVRFYLISILFILFDLEVAFLLPWGIVIDKIGWLGFNAGLIFLLILTIGFVYEWRKGALDWE